MGANSPYTDGGAVLIAGQYLASAPTNPTTDTYRNLQVDASGNLKVNVVVGGGGGGGGAVTIADPTTSSNQAAVLAPGGSGSFAVAVQGVPGGTAQPISATSLPLPTGASTSAKQPALGTAGTPSADVLTVQGATSMTALKTDGSAVTQPVSLASLPSLAAGSAAIGSVFISQGGNVSPVSLPGDAFGANQGMWCNVQLMGYDRANSQWDRICANPIGTDPGSGAKGALVVQGSASGISMPVSLASLPALAAGTNAIGQVGGKTAKIAVTPTITSGSAYTTGNVVGGKLTFSSALLTAGSGVLESISIRCKSVQTATFLLALFDSNPTNTTWTDKTAPSINAADIPFLVGIYQLASFSSSLGTHTIYNLNGISQTLAAGATTLYGVLVVTGTPTFASTSDITAVLGILQD